MTEPAEHASSSLLPAPSHAAIRIFGARLQLAQRFAESLAVDGVLRGLIGPREVPRLWDRHLVNSAVLAELLPPGARVIDVGSGAGLPGVPLAIARPDLELDLVEPMDKRVAFLRQVVEELELTAQVRIFRGRAPEIAAEVAPAPWVVARAVAPLDRLVGWCLPLVSPTGRLIAVKGERAGDELAAARRGPGLRGMASADIMELGTADAPTRVVLMVRAAIASDIGADGPRSTKRRAREAR